jgi:hypothetical protein
MSRTGEKEAMARDLFGNTGTSGILFHHFSHSPDTYALTPIV